MNNKKGFTLIELLTVVLILAVLTSIALPQYQKAIYRAEAANALINLKSLYDSAKRTYAMHSEFPSSFADLDVKVLSDEDNPTSSLNSGGFKFEFAGKGMKACRNVEAGTSNSLCLQVSYAIGSGKRDVYTCTATGKYEAVCAAMGKCTGGTCTLE